MSVRINFEIGHEASIRSKRTVDGFTHDWEVFVRGCDKADIHYFIDKVVFHLHETFPNPKRVIKEPPYSVRESGYAGFNLPIDIYLRNNDEPKKIRFNYDLNLQTTGPTICKVQKEKYVFNNPSEEFRHKLVKGGGYIINSDNSRDISSSSDKQQQQQHQQQLINKSKSASSSDMVKKHRVKEHKAQEDSFTDLFGTPITKTSKVSPDGGKMPTATTMKTSPTNIPAVVKPEKSSNSKKSKSKHSPKEKDRDKEKKDKSGSEKKHKDEKKSKERSKDKERKDKASLKRERSPMQQQQNVVSSPVRSPKRPPSPKRITSPKRPPSPPAPAQPTGKLKSDEKKSDEPVTKEKIKTESKKSKHEQKEKEKDKEKKEQHSSNKSHKEKDAANRTAEPQQKEQHSTKLNKESKQQQQASSKEQIPYNKMSKEKSARPADETNSERQQKVTVDHHHQQQPEKQKHKHKKKDSKEKREKKEEKSARDKRKEEKKQSDKCGGDGGFFERVYKDEVKQQSSPNNIEKNSAINTKPSSEPVAEKNSTSSRGEKSRGLNALQAELNDDTSSSSVVTHDESSIEVPGKVTAPQLHSAVEKQQADQVVNKKNNNKDKTKSDAGSPEKKRKRKHESNSAVKEEAATQMKGNEEPSSAKITRDEQQHDEYTPKQQQQSESSNISRKEAAAADGGGGGTRTVVDVSQDYMSILKELQHKIMTLQDNDELQRVVQLIAETGQFEITAQTFDFDLCALDRDTVRRLQEFFALS